jgi:hypothetical protein
MRSDDHGQEPHRFMLNIILLQTRIFAQMMVDDLDLPAGCVSMIAQCIDDQINESAPFADFYHVDRRVLIRLDVCYVMCDDCC